MRFKVLFLVLVLLLTVSSVMAVDDGSANQSTSDNQPRVNPPSLSSPSNYSVFNRNITSSITHSWTSVNGSLEYWLTVFPSGSSGNPVYNASVGNVTSKSVTCSSWNPNVFVWYVKVRTSAGWSAYSTTRQYIVDVPASAPSLSSPTSGYTCTINDNVTFSWNSVPSAARYAFRVTTSGGTQERYIEPASSPLSVTISSSYFTTGAHNWSVRAIKQTPDGYNANTYETTMGWGPYTSRSFTINPLPANPPNLLTPTNGSSLTGPPYIFTWQAVSGAGLYHLKIATNSSFTNVVHYSDTISGSATSYSTSYALTYGTTYYWQMRTLNSSGTAWGSWSSYRSFTASQSALPAPTLLTPANGGSLTGPPYVFTWQSVSGAGLYHLKIATNSSFTNVVHYSDTIPGSATSYSTSYALTYGTTYYWQMRTLNSSGTAWGSWSSSRSFTASQSTLPAPTLLTPANGGSLTGPPYVFTWQSVSGAGLYHLKIATDTAFNNVVHYSETISGSATSYSTNYALSYGTIYYWQMRTLNSSGTAWGSWSSYRSFTASQSTLPAPTLLTPANGGSLTGPPYIFTWQSVSGAGLYHLKIATDSAFNNVVHFSDTISGSATSYSTSYALTHGNTYFWQMRTLNSSGTAWGTWGQYQSFIAVQATLPPPTMLTPTNGASLTGPPYIFTWQAVATAGLYHLKIATDAAFNNLVHFDAAISGSATSYTTSYALTHGITYYWQMRTLNSSGTAWGTWGQYQSFIAGQATLPPPTLLTPANGASLTGPPYVFTWQAVSTAGLYHLKIATDAAFNSVVHYSDTISGSATSYSTSYALTHGITYYWQMRTLNSSGTAWGTWGQYQSFIAQQDFGLIFPINSTEVTTQNIVFDWNDVANAQYYRVYVDDDPSFNSPEIDTAEHPYVPQSEMNVSQYEICGNWLPPFTVFYWKVAVAFIGGGYEVSSVGQFEYNPGLALNPTWLPVYRAYKDSDVDHFYCTSSSHLQYAIDSLFVFEKVEGFLAGSPYIPSNLNSDLKAVYRLSSAGGVSTNEKSHFYTTDDAARNAKIADDWYYEGIIGFTEDNDNFVPMYFLYKGGQNPPALNDYFYTTSEIEKNRAVSNGYSNMGIMCHLSLDGDGSTESAPTTQPTAGRGINPYNGNLAEYSKDVFSIPGGKMSLDLSFSYNSYSTKLTAPINPIGNGWNHNYQSYIYISSTRLFVFWPDGTIHVYNASSPYNAITPGVYDTMQRITTTQYRITKKDQTTLTFNVLAGYSTVATLAGIQDRNSNSLSMVYDANDRLNYVTDRFGRRLQFYYYTDAGKTHLVHHVTDTAGGRTVYFNYDNHYNLVSFQDAKGYSTQYSYEVSRPYAHLLTSIAYPNGNVVSCLYDSSQRVTNQTIGSTGQSLVVTGYSSPTSRSVSDGGITSQYSYYQGVYAKIQQLTTPDVAAGFQYSDTNNPTLPTSITDGSGNTTSLTYDTRGNVLTISKPGGISHQYTYNTINDITQYRDPLNHYSYFGYTSGNLTSMQTPRGTTNYQYGSYGKLTQTTTPIGQQTTFSYDSYDNIASVTQPLGLTTSYSYDSVSRVTSTTNPMSQTTTYQYDANDNLTSFTELGDVTSYSYDQNDNLLSVSKNGQTTSMHYNSMGLMSQISNPMGNISYLYYNPNGTLQSVQKPVGSISYSYNSDGTVSAVNSQDAWANYTYNGNRKVTNISDNNGSISFGYDSNNRVTSINSSYGFTGNVSYTYDAADNIASMTYGGNTVQYTYWDDNLLRAVRDWNNRVTTFTYRADGSLSSIQYPNGIVCNNGYDSAGRLTSLSNAGTTSINSYSYTLNALGFHTSVNQSEPLEPFPMAPTNLNCTYDNANRLLTAGGAAFTHNGNGCMTSRSEPQTSYSWDALDRLLSITGSSNITYTYDALGNRRSRTENGITTRFVLDLNSSMTNVLIETNASGTPVNYYVYANGMLISRIKPNGDTRYYHYDFRGSTIAMTNDSQQITHKYSYDPYGKVVTMLEEDTNSFRFVGGWGVMDEGNGLYYMRARYYDQFIGRFISEDPKWSSNLYSYADNNSIMLTDPTGLASWGKFLFDATESGMGLTGKFADLFAMNISNTKKGIDFIAAMKLDKLSKISKYTGIAGTAIFVGKAEMFLVENLYLSIYGLQHPEIPSKYLKSSMSAWDVLSSAPGVGTFVSFGQMEIDAYKSFKALQKQWRKK